MDEMMKTTQQETDDLETSSAPPDVIQDPLTVPFKPVRTEMEKGKPPDPNQPDQTTENPLTMGLQSVMRGMSQTTEEPTTGGSKPRFAVSGTETNIELEQGTGKGSGLVVNAMDTGEFAHDGVSMTTRYLNELEQSPDLSEEEDQDISSMAHLYQMAKEASSEEDLVRVYNMGYKNAAKWCANELARKENELSSNSTRIVV